MFLQFQFSHFLVEIDFPPFLSSKLHEEQQLLERQETVLNPLVQCTSGDEPSANRQLLEERDTPPKPLDDSLDVHFVTHADERNAKLFRSKAFSSRKVSFLASRLMASSCTWTYLLFRVTPASKIHRLGFLFWLQNGIRLQARLRRWAAHFRLTR